MGEVCRKCGKDIEHPKKGKELCDRCEKKYRQTLKNLKEIKEGEQWI
jgi:hypothetical protein